MSKQQEGRGRRKGSHNRGYFYRDGRGWFTKNAAGKFTPLTDEEGNRLRDERTPPAVLKLAHARFLTTQPKKTKGASGITMLEIIDRYLAHAEKSASSQTYEGRSRTLFDFAYGFPPRFWKSKEKPKASDRIRLLDDDGNVLATHPGYGLILVDDLRAHHIQAWVDVHADWTDSGSRTRIQAVKRALNYAKSLELIDRNPIRGMKMPKGRARVTYLNDAQEAAILKHLPRSLATAVRILIRTGMRPSELAKLTADHVTDHGEKGIQITFKPKESKNGKERVVRVSEPWICELVRKLSRGTEPIFRNSRGGRLVVKAMSYAFRRAIKKAKDEGVKFDADVCLYSTRHTFAKRCLCGYWKGQHIGIEILARLMGNSAAVCKANYLNWTKDFDDPLWAAC